MATHYLSLDPGLEAQIAHDLALQRRHPQATADEEVLRRQDKAHDAATLIRPAFARDCEKILNLPAYNRYTDKTQVFSFTKNDDISRRSLHVQLVARISRSIGRILGLNLDLIEAIALGHDIGHTPFGHAGEMFLKEIHREHTGRYFNHNVHSVRVLDTLYPRNISLQTLNGVLCHNGEFAQRELICEAMTSFDQLDKATQACQIDEGQIAHLRPSTLEGCLVRVCDMIAYLGKDRQDALNMGLINNLDLFDSQYLGKTNAEIINNMTVDIISQSYGQDRICMSEAAFSDLKQAKRQNYAYIYLNEGVIEGAGNIIQTMFHELYDYFLDDVQQGREASRIYKHHIGYLSHRSDHLSAEDYLLEDPHQIVVDYLASMTDQYFLRTYEDVFPGRFSDFPYL